MAKFLIMLFDDEAAWEAADADGQARVIAGHDEFSTRNRAAVLSGEGLCPQATAKTVRPDGAGGVTVTDGPFVETKEALGGYYLVEAPDIDAAVALAQQVPLLAGAYEVRPVMTFA